MKSYTLLFVFIGSLLVVMFINNPLYAQKTSDDYLKNAFVEVSPEKHHPPILHIEGTPYEMGYQYGYLLSDHIKENYSTILTSFAYYLTDESVTYSKEDLKEFSAFVKQRVSDYFSEVVHSKAPEFERELQGMADGLKAVGVNMDYNDLLTLAAFPEILNNNLFLTQFFDLTNEQRSRFHPIANCSGFVAWNQATVGGDLFHGANLDFNTFGVLHKTVTVLVAKPDKGYSYAGMVFAGFFPMVGMNAKGVSINTMTSESIDADLLSSPRLPHVFQTRRILQYAADIEEAENLIAEKGDTTGWNILVSDGANHTAVDIESSANKTAFVRPWDDPETVAIDEDNGLMSTNQFVTCPGFRGYQEINLIPDQLQYDEIDTINWDMSSDFIDNWMALLNNKTYVRAESWDRWQRMWALFSEHYGQLTVDTIIKIISDTQVGPNGGYISGKTPQIQVTEDAVPHLMGPDKPIIQQDLSSVFSCVFDPMAKGKGIVWVAAGATPAQTGPFYPIDLEQQLNQLK